jgi:hypothetical protein
MNRTATYIVAGVILGAGAGTAIYGFRYFGAESDLHRAIPRVDIASLSVPGSPFSASHDETIVWIYNDIGRREKWREEDRVRVFEILTAWRPQDLTREAMTPAEYEEWDAQRELIAMLESRAHAGTMMDEEVALAWRNQVVDLIDHAQPYARRWGIGSASSGGLFAVPEILAKVERLVLSDPDERVRHAANLHVGRHYGVDSPSVPCPTCPGGSP